jgi:uncharacterized membrane protein YedE/YeeE
MALQAVIGGVLIGISGVILLLFNGRILGVSGIASTFVTRLLDRKWTARKERFDLLWRGFFILGLLAGGASLLALFNGTFAPRPSPASTSILVVSGLLVGIGTRMGLGCTSGHGVCGISRFSLRSLFATLIFISGGMFTVFLLKQWGGF